MLFPERIKNAREDMKLPQRTIAALLEVDTPMYSRIERGERRANREQVLALAQYLNINQKELLKLWLADKVYGVVNGEDDADEILKIVAEEIVKYNNK